MNSSYSRRTALHRRLLLIVLLGLLPFVGYAEKKTPHQIIQVTAQQVLEVLKNDEAAIRKNPNKINDLVDQIILPVCDLEKMSKFILAKHWKTANDAQRVAFTNEFKTMLIRTYGKHMVEYSGAEITVLPEKNIEKKQYQTVNTELNLKNGSKPLLIAYVFRTTENTAKIVDVRVEGMSMLRVFRTVFTYEIADTSLEELIERMANNNRPALAMNTLSN